MNAAFVRSTGVLCGLTGVVLFLNAQAPRQGGKKEPDRNEVQKKQPPADEKKKPVPIGIIIPGAAPGPPEKTIRDGTRSQLRLKEFGAGCAVWGVACESRAAIPTSGGSPKSLAIASAARLLPEDPDYPGMFVFDYQCGASTSFIAVKVSTVLRPTVAPQNRGMRTALPCSSRRFVWNPGFTDVDGGTPNLHILVTEIPEDGEPEVISPVVRARRVQRPDAAHRVLLSFPSGRFQSFTVAPDQAGQAASRTQAPERDIRTVLYLTSPGAYRITGEGASDLKETLRIRISREQR